MPGKLLTTERRIAQAIQALAMVLTMLWRPGGLTAPVAAAWLCAALDGADMPWGMLAGMAAGSAMVWPMQVQAAILPLGAAMALLARPGGYGAAARALLAGLLALADAVTASGLNPDAAPLWLMSALLSAGCAILLTAARAFGNEGARARTAASQAPARRRVAGLRAFVGLAENASPAATRAAVGAKTPSAGDRSGRTGSRWRLWRRIEKAVARPRAGRADDRSWTARTAGASHAGQAMNWRLWHRSEKTVDALKAGQAVDRRNRTEAVDAPRAGRRLDRAAALAGCWVVPLAAAAGAAATLGGEWGVLVAGVALALWQEAGGMLLAALQAALLASMGAPLAATGALCALWAGMDALRRRGSVAAALGGLAAAGAWLLAGGPPDSVGYLAALLPSGAAIALQPRPVPASRRIADARAALEWQSRWLRSDLAALSGVLTDMAQGYGSGLDPPREDALLAELRVRLCDGCARYERCWNGRAGEGTRLLCELIAESVNGTLPGRATPEMMRLCGRAGTIPERLYGELRRFSENRNAHMARMDGAQRARLSISVAAEAVRSLADARADNPSPGGAELRRLERTLRGSGLADVTALDLGGQLALISPGGWTESARRLALRACADVWNRCWSCWDFRSGTALILRPAAGLTASMGCDAISMEAGRNGDSVRMAALDEGRWMVAISDGMGVGAAAARESGRAVAVVERFLRAGLPPGRAALLANQLLLAEGRPEMFTTLDLCVIDGWRREATFVKMAACDSFLLRGGGARAVAGGRLPMGILSEATPQTATMELEPGDVIVMGTDGAMDGLSRQMLAQCFPAHSRLEARALARALRQAGDERRIHADDQTLAVIRIEAADARRAHPVRACPSGAGGGG